MPQLPHSLNLPYLELLYQKYLSDPAAAGSEWNEFFSAVAANGAAPGSGAASVPGERAIEHPSADAAVQPKVANLIDSYRSRGHCIAHLDPLGAVRLQP